MVWLRITNAGLSLGILLALAATAWRIRGVHARWEDLLRSQHETRAETDDLRRELQSVRSLVIEMESQAASHDPAAANLRRAIEYTDLEGRRLRRAEAVPATPPLCVHQGWSGHLAEGAACTPVAGCAAGLLCVDDGTHTPRCRRECDRGGDCEEGNYCSFAYCSSGDHPVASVCGEDREYILAQFSLATTACEAGEDRASDACARACPAGASGCDLPGQYAGWDSCTRGAPPVVTSCALLRECNATGAENCDAVADWYSDAGCWRYGAPDLCSSTSTEWCCYGTDIVRTAPVPVGGRCLVRGTRLLGEGCRP